MLALRNAARAAATVVMLVYAASMMLDARPYTVEDLFKSQGLGKMVVDPTGRWLVFEKREAFLAMERFDRLSRSDVLRSRLYRVDLRAPASARLFREAALPGTILLGFSPRGRRLAIARLHGDTFRLGVVNMATGALRWLSTTPSYSPFRATWAWLSDDRLLVVAEADRPVPWWLDADIAIARVQPERWAATAAGHTAVTIASSGGAPVGDLSRPAQKLVLLDLASDTAHVLMQGHLAGISLAPGKRMAAVLEEGEQVQLAQDAHVTEASVPLRQSIALVDLVSGAVLRPCAGCALAGASSWSPDGRSFAFWATHPEGATPSLVRADTTTHAVTETLSSDIAPPEPDPNTGMAAACDMRWRGRAVFVRAAKISAAANNLTWYRIEQGDFPAVPVEPGIVPGEDACADGFGATAPDGIASQPLRMARHRGRLSRVGRRSGNFPMDVPAAARVDAWSVARHASSILVHVTNPSGVASLQLATKRRTVTLETFNAHFKDVDAAQMLALHHEAGQGRVTSWLVLPPGTPAGAKLPLVVVPYPGQLFGETPPVDQQPGGERFHASAQLLVARGFAVLLPSLPMPDILADQGFSFSDLLAPALDAATASGYVDPDHVGLWGHSYGAYAAVMAATQTNRFRAVIASSGIYDLAGVVGTFSGLTRSSPEQGLPIASRYAWAETGQGRMGGPPWTVPARYIANSPVYLAQKISAPLLIIAADRDVSPLGQAEQLFSAMFRQGKDAQLVTYWGEGHVVGSPGNLRDMYPRIFAFFARTLGSPKRMPTALAHLREATNPCPGPLLQ